jgi:hypothetical protein
MPDNAGKEGVIDPLKFMKIFVAYLISFATFPRS